MIKKVILGAVVLIVLVVGVAVTLVVSQADRLVADAVQTYGSAATKTDVSVSGVDLALTEGTGTLSGLTIGNPEGYETDYAVRIDETELTLDLASLSSDVPVVSEMLLTGAHINAEQIGDATNLTDIQELMSSSDGSAQSTSEGRIVIDRFRLANARVTLTSELLNEPEELMLEDVVVNGVGRGGGATYSEAAEAILTPILGAARTAVQARLRSAAGEAVRDEVREELDEKLEEEAGGRLRDLLDR